MSDNGSRLRLSRVVFGSTWQNPDFPTGNGMFSLEDLGKRYAEYYGTQMDVDAAMSFLNSMVTTGYVLKQDDMYGVIMTPLNA